MSEAKEADGVHAVYCAQDLVEAGLKNNMRYGIVRMRDGRRTPRPPRPVLAEDVVRFAGEPVAVVIADTAVQAKDAAELIEFDYEDLPVHLGLGTGGYAMHEEAPENVAFDWAAGEGDAIDAAFADAAHVVSMQLDDNRVIANSMEPRGCYAEWSDNRLHLAINGQSVWVILDELVYNLGLDRSAVRVTTPDVGGGFGMKGCIYPENLAVAQAARMLGRTVHWMGTRSDAMLNDNGGRDLTSVAEAAFDEDFRILAYRVGTVANMGAYISPYAQFIQTELFQKVVTGVYDIPHTLQEVVGVFTNTAPVDAYRGAGRPEGIYVIERFMDRAARELGIDSLELRRRNFIKPNQFPYRNFANETVDVGDFDKVLSRAEEEADLAGFDRRRRESEAEGRLRGLGVCYYIETILGDPNETTRIEFAKDGFANMYVGTQSNGQGHETAYAQILHERSGIPFERIRCIQGDSDLIRTGGGTGGSRSVTTQGTSIRGTADKVIAKLSPFVADLLDASDHEVLFEEGTFRVANSNKYMDIMEAASAALAAGRNDLVSTEVETEIDDKSF
ncbi:MAG: xanthine dehydrogenase family protein, partial [Rhodobacteraceae bacterium]|nr:xanthine dehydrogenase family protein [Paracoccaceae bacterium]